MTLEAKLTGGAGFQMGGVVFSGSVARILVELEGCEDARGWFEKVPGGWTFEKDSTFVTDAEYAAILAGLNHD